MRRDSGGFRMLSVTCSTSISSQQWLTSHIRTGNSICGYCGAVIQGTQDEPYQGRTACLECGSLNREEFRSPFELRLSWAVHDLARIGWVTLTDDLSEVSLTDQFRTDVLGPLWKVALPQLIADLPVQMRDPRALISHREQWTAHLYDLQRVVEVLFEDKPETRGQA